MTNFIDLKHSRIAHKAVGNGPDLVFVHGWPLDSRTYRHIVPELSKHFTCHLIDLPGVGETIWDDQTPIGIEAHCHTLREVVDALNLSSYALVAHDSGGVFARHLAANDPDRVRGLVLSNTDIPRHYSPTLKLLVNSAKLPGASFLMRLLLRIRLFRLSKYFGKGMFYDLEQFEGEFGDLYIRPLYQDKKVLNGQMQLIYGWDWDFLDQLTEIHGRIKAPVQLIWGANDVIFPLNKGRPMANEFGAGAEFKVIKKSRLYVQEEQPEAFLQHALPFLQSCF
ncbi:MAG: alpha/beta fold hydrolase [Anaerolineae bacterium]